MAFIRVSQHLKESFCTLQSTLSELRLKLFILTMKRSQPLTLLHGCHLGYCSMIVLFLVQTSCRGEDERVDVHIVVTAPITGQWPVGNLIMLGAEMATDHVNGRDDILRDYKIVIHPNDSQCETGKGIDVVYWQLYRPPVKTFVLTAGCSLVCEPVATAMRFWNMVQMGSSCSSPALSNKKAHPRFFRTITPDAQKNDGHIALMKKFNWKKVAALTQTYPVFATVITDLARRMEKNDMQIITSELFIDDPIVQVKNIKKHDARIIFLGCYEVMAIQVFCEAYRNGMYGAKYVWIFPTWYTNNWWEKSTDCTPEEILTALEGMLATDFIYGNIKEERGIAGYTRSEAETILYDYIRGRDIDVYPDWHTSYDAMWTLALALNSSIEKLETIGKKIEDFTYTDKQMADILQTAVNQTTFLGVTGRVSFDANGDNYLYVGISQIQNGKEVLVGYFDKLEGKLKWLSDIKWNGGSVPKDSTTYIVELLFVSEPVYIAMCCFSSVGIIIACLLLAFNISYRKYRLIKMSSPVMNNIILIGCIVSYLTVYAQELFEEFTGILCRIRSLTVMLGFSLSVGALFAKTWRVYVIFTNKTKKVILKDYKLVLIVLLIVSVDIIVFVTKELVAPMTVGSEIALVETYDQGDLVVQREILVCKSEYDLYFQGIIYGYKGLMLIFGAFLAWQTRKVNIPALNDSQYIGMCIYNVAVLSILSAILAFALEKQLQLQYVLTSGFLIFGTTTVQLIIFIPKVIKIQDMKKQVEEEGSEVTSSVTGGTANTTTTAVDGEEELTNLRKQNEELKDEVKTLRKQKEELEAELSKQKTKN